MPLSPEETQALAKKAQAELAKAKTKEEVVKVWSESYGSLGHKALGRMLVGTYDNWAEKQKAKGK